MLKRHFVICAVLAGACILTGCSKKIEGNEKTHPTYIKAKTDWTAGRFSDAANGLNDLLARAPRSALLHKELATLYGDNLADYYRAIYHYQRYIELGKLSENDKTLYRGYQAACKRNAAERMIQEDPTLVGDNQPRSAEIDGATANRLALLQQQNAFFQKRYTEQMAKIQTLESEVAALKKAPAKTAAKAPAAAKTAAAKTAAAAPAAAKAAAATGHDTYEVQSGDTLSRIARKTYGVDSETYRKMIMDANGLSSPNRIYAGQILKLPKLPR